MENITDISKIEEKLANVQSDEDAIRIFAEAGIKVSAEQLAAIGTEDELDEAALDDVSGGLIAPVYGRYLVNWYRQWKSRQSKGRSSGGGGKGAFGGGGGGGGR